MSRYQLFGRMSGSVTSSILLNLQMSRAFTQSTRSAVTSSVIASLSSSSSSSLSSTIATSLHSTRQLTLTVRLADVLTTTSNSSSSVETSSSSSSSSSTSSCSSPSCCGGTCGSMSSLIEAEDDEEPFIGAPRLSKTKLAGDKERWGADINNPTHNTSISSSPPQYPTSSSHPPPSEAPKTVKQKCDPYEQGGKPLTPQVVAEKLIMLDPGWTHNLETNSLIKHFSFKHLDDRNAHLKGSEMIQRISMAMIADGHMAYGIGMTPRKRMVSVQLKTPPLGGLSFADLMLAMKCDAAYFHLSK